MLSVGDYDLFGCNFWVVVFHFHFLDFGDLILFCVDGRELGQKWIGLDETPDSCSSDFLVMAIEQHVGNVLGTVPARDAKPDRWQVLHQFGFAALHQRVSAFFPCNLNCSKMSNVWCTGKFQFVALFHIYLLFELIAHNYL